MTRMTRLNAAMILAVLFVFSVPGVPGWGSPQRVRFAPSAASLAKARSVLKTLSMDEKIGQLVHIGINARYLNRESEEFLRLRKEISDLRVGGVIVFAGPVYETVHLVNRLQEAAKIPLLISADFETGAGMRMSETVNFPWSMAVAATGDPSLARRMGSVTGREARALGVHQVFAPVLDINDNPLNPVINVRSFGEDPETVSMFGVAFAEGIQSERVIATAKHFPGHGNTSVDSHRGLPEIDLPLDALRGNEFVPFVKAIDAGIASVMVSHIAMPALDDERVEPRPERMPSTDTDSEVVTEASSIPATLSKPIVTGILREQMGFDGLVVTDALGMAGLTIYFGPEEAAVRALLAGNDILLKPDDAALAIRGLREAFANGRISRHLIDAAVLKQLAWKAELGLFRRKLTPLSAIDGIVSSNETVKLSDEIAEKAITLVENRSRSLPLKEGARVFLLAVTNGPDYFSAGRTFASTLTSLGYRVERQAIDQRSGAKESSDAIGTAKKADAVIVALFGRVRSGAEESIGLPSEGKNALEQILEARPDTISVAFGNPYLINSFPAMNCYVVGYGDMVSLQKAAARKISGRSEFRGLLPVSLSGKYPKGSGIRN